MNKRTTSAVAVYLYLENNGLILIGRRFNTGYMDGNYQLFAGHIEIGELPMHALVREMSEELNIDLEYDDLILVHTSSRPKHDDTGNRLDLYFKATKWQGRLQINEPDKCDDLKWVDPRALPENFVPHVRVAIHSIFNNWPYSEMGLEWMKTQTPPYKML